MLPLKPVPVFYVTSLHTYQGLESLLMLLLITRSFSTADLLSSSETSHSMGWAAPGACRSPALPCCVSCPSPTAAVPASPQHLEQLGSCCSQPRAPSTTPEATPERLDQECDRLQPSRCFQSAPCREARYFLMAAGISMTAKELLMPSGKAASTHAFPAVCGLMSSQINSALGRADPSRDVFDSRR